MTYSGFVPAPTPETEPYWQAARDGRLVAQRCDACQTLRFPPSAGCGHCGSGERSWVALAGTGSVFSYVVNHRAANGYESAVPYCTAIVELTEGLRMMTTLVGVHAADDGSLLDAAVAVEFDRITDEIALPRFRPTSMEAGAVDHG